MEDTVKEASHGHCAVHYPVWVFWEILEISVS